MLQKLLSHSSEPPRDPREVRGDVPEEISSIALRLMAKQPGQRFQNPQELVAALLMACDRLGISAGGTATPIWVAPRPTWWDVVERHLPWLLPTVLLLLVIYAAELLQGRDPVTRADMQPRLLGTAANAAAEESSNAAQQALDEGSSDPTDWCGRYGRSWGGGTRITAWCGTELLLAGPAVDGCVQIPRAFEADGIGGWAGNFGTRCGDR